MCECRCGGNVIREISELRNSLKHSIISSCGCYIRQHTGMLNVTHRKSKTRLYKIYRSMLSRCTNPNATGYANYGGRSIGICEEWENDFSTFEEWAQKSGYDENLSLDRIDVDEGYCPLNCRFVTKIAQSHNRRNTIYVIFEGEKVRLAALAQKFNISYGTLYERIIYKNIAAEVAVKIPIGRWAIDCPIEKRIK